MPPKNPYYQVVGTKESFNDKPSLNKSASRWKKTDLVKLGVDYHYSDRFDEIVFGYDDVPTELLQGNLRPLDISDI
jgi:hypothetical protein